MEKKQIVFIHGGNSFSQHDAFLEYLRMCEIADPLDEIIVKKWRMTIRDAFHETHEVYYPSMPNSSNAEYLEWKIWFERYFAFLRDGVVLIGHSLGGMFLAKYLSEEIMPVKVHALYLVAAPFEADHFDHDGEDCHDFVFDPKNLPRLAKQVGETYVFHSTDDPIVPYAHALKYQKALPAAELVSFVDRGHFILEEFPEIIEHIKDRATQTLD